MAWNINHKEKVMSIPVNVVIGSNFGDEGKGSVTDLLSIRKTLNIRFNGGAQAGHTVCYRNKRHVFHHFGAGSFQGAKTYLSKHFIVNPLIFKKEYEELSSKINILPKDMILFSDLKTLYQAKSLKKASTQFSTKLS